MTQSNYSPGFEAQVRKAMEMPEPDYQKMNMMREQFVRKGSAALKTRNHLTETGRKSTFLTRRPAWQWMMVGLVILITAVLATPGTVKAIRSLLGFIPGIGYVVNTPSALVLAEPVVIERERFTLTILQAVSTS